jgi:tRNA pseudouridine55 synthase
LKRDSGSLKNCGNFPIKDGVALLFKPVGITSFAALGEVKRTLGTGRVGHAGTLDRFAEGLLLVLCGKLTRLCARVTFGAGTDTLDPEGRLIAEGPVPVAQEIEDVLPGFRGPIMQIPPLYSAIHVKGKRAYRAAREEEEVRLDARPVTVHSLEMVEYRPPEAIMKIVCSKGTYVRALARDIASRLGTCAFVSGLRRTRIGGFLLEEAGAPGDFEPGHDLLSPSVFVERCPGLERLEVRAEWAPLIAKGVQPKGVMFLSPPSGEGSFCAFSPGGTLLALVEARGGLLRYGAVFAGSGGT